MTKLSSDSIKKIIIILLLALISPFIINCFFAYPQTDDFCYSFISKDLGFISSQYHWYMKLTGRFTSTALLSINPLVYNSLVGYKMVFAILIIIQLASMYLLTDALTKKALLWQEKLIFSLLMLFAYLDQMDDVRSGLYWMAGVITYQVAETLIILYFSLILRVKHDPMNDNWLHRCIIIVLSIVLGGTNEIVLFLVLLITSLITLYNYAINKIINPFQIATFIAVATGGGISLLSPGNFARMHEYDERKNLFITVWNTLNSVLTSIEVWITSPITLILMCLILFAVSSKPQLKIVYEEYKIVSSVCLLLFMTFICFFIPYWSTGMVPQNRVINMIYLFFLIGWMINLAIIFAHYGENIIFIIKKIPFKSGCVAVALFIIALFTLGTSNFVLVTKDLLSGESFRYNAQMWQRVLQTVNASEDNLTLENITSTPRSLVFCFLAQDRNYWVNGCYASYFGKKSVALITNKNCTSAE